jgi:hypothetical protein
MLSGKVTIRTGSDFEPLPADKYTVQIADVSNLMSFNQWQGKEVEVLKYTFIVLDNKLVAEKIGGNDMSRGRYLWHKMSPSLSSKSWLLKLARAVYGRELTKTELEEFDPEAIIGKQVDVMVDQSPSKDGTAIFNNILSYSKNTKPLTPVEQKAGKGVVEKTTEPAREAFVDPLPGGDDPFASEAKTDTAQKQKELDEILAEDDEEEEDEEALEAKLKAMKAKKAGAKKNKEAKFPLN